MNYNVWGDLAIAYGLDLLIGDPPWLYHPVRVIGGLIRTLERILRRWAGRRGGEAGKARAEKAMGVILTAVTVAVSGGAVLLLLEIARRISPVLFHILNIYFLYTAFAARCLADEALKVKRVLQKNDLAGARRQVGMLVGRETDRLNQPEIIRAVVETTAENTVDGVISPLLYAAAGALLGAAAPLAYAFKAVSTLDSMVGYKNEKYLNLGWAAAKLDDAANYLPARLSGLLIPLSALLLGKNAGRSLRIMARDRRNHASPNCAYAEAAVAGALGVQLGGDNIYFGRVVPKPTIGDPIRPLEVKDISATVALMYTASCLTVILCLAVLFWVGIG